MYVLLAYQVFGVGSILFFLKELSFYAMYDLCLWPLIVLEKFNRMQMPQPQCISHNALYSTTTEAFYSSHLHKS